MKKTTSLSLVCVMLLGVLASCTGNTQNAVQTTLGDSSALTGTVTTGANNKQSAEEIILGHLEKYAKDAYANMIKNYWSEEKKYLVDPYKDGHGRDTLSDIMWVYTMGLLGFETYFATTADESVKYYVQNQMNAWMNNRSKDWILSTGNNNNPAHDDAAWTAMAFMLAYKMLGNETYLDMCHDMVKRSYDYWQDGSTANGLWYKYNEDGTPGEKSIYCVGLMLSELEYYNITKGTKREDLVLHQRTMELYEWVEENMGRNGPKKWNGTMVYTEDYLYFCDFKDDKKTGAYYPESYNNPNAITPAGSCSSLFGNTGMAVLNKRLYDMTGDEKYLNRAVNTANALVYSVYNVSGTIMNDRDAWTNCAFIGYFVREVLPLEGISEDLGRMFMKTAVGIMKYSYFEGGYYGADWTGGTRWITNGDLGQPTWFTVSATTTHMLYATYYAMKNGLISVTNKDVSLFNFKVNAIKP